MKLNIKNKIIFGEKTPTFIFKHCNITKNLDFLFDAKKDI